MVFLTYEAEDVMNSLSHDGKTVVCNGCGKIEPKPVNHSNAL